MTIPQSTIDNIMSRIEKAIKKYPKTYLMIIREDLEKAFDTAYKVAYIHGQTEERERIKEVLGL